MGGGVFTPHRSKLQMILQKERKGKKKERRGEEGERVAWESQRGRRLCVERSRTERLLDQFTGGEEQKRKERKEREKKKRRKK